VTIGSRAVWAGSGGPSWLRRPIAVPVGAALLAVALLCGVAGVAASEASRTIQSDAQGRVRSNHDAAVRALVRQSDRLEGTVATYAADAQIIDSLRASPTPASWQGAQDQLSILARSQDSPSAFVADTRGRIVALYPIQPELIGQGFGFRDWFRGASSTGKPYVSEAYRTAASTRWSSPSPPRCSMGRGEWGLSSSCGNSTQCGR
jgi:hypothetical protein